MPIEPRIIEEKVSFDINWLTDKWRHVGRGEPSDEEIIWFYDAGNVIPDSVGTFDSAANSVTEL